MILNCKTSKGASLRTLDRYIFREVAVTWIAVTVVLLVILLSNQLARVLAQAAANNFPSGVVFALIGLTSAGYLTVVVPIGFFLAIMLGLGRLYHESEMAAIQACGVGPTGLYRPIGALGIVVAGLLVWLSFWAVPDASAQARKIRLDAVREAQFGQFEPGRFRNVGKNVVFYAEKIDDNGILYNVDVFIDHSAEQNKDGSMEIWSATRAEQRGAGQAQQTVVLYDGVRYEGVAGEGQFRIIQFSEASIPINLGELNTKARTADLKTTHELVSSDDPHDIAELQWRISTPVLALILMVIAVPLSRLRPRQGRFGKIGIAILAYFLYSQMLVAARTWIESQVAPAFIGLWWVHAIALCVGLWLLARNSPLGRARLVTA
jgi:lipopolysaccharide export system permease protein